MNRSATEAVSEAALSESVSALCALGEKVSGSEEEARACGFIVERLRSYGYAPKVHEFESYISYPRSTTLRIHGGVDRDIAAVGVAFGLPTAAMGHRADIVFVGAGDEAGFAGKDVKGKFALMTKLPSPSNALLAASKGAAGMICMSAGKQRHKMIITPVWGTPEFDQARTIPRLHVASISGEDGNRIIEALRERPLSATIVADVFEGWRNVRLPTAEIRGREPLFALVGAHYCSWFDGSTDNVTGDACVLELARVLKPLEGQLRYGIRFCWWPGHSHGRYSGSTWYADHFREELFENGIVYFNIDSPGVKGATVYVPRHQMAEVSAFNEAVTKEVTGWMTLTSANAQLALGKRGDRYVSPTRPSRAADQSFWGIGLSSMSVYSMLTADNPDRDPNVGGSGGAWWWHSEHETIDKFDAAILKQDTALYATILQRLANADLLPLDLAAIAQDYLDSLREYDEAAGEYLPFAELLARARELQATFLELHHRCKALSGPAETHAANRLFLRIARTLNPVLYQAGSPFAHDPALGSRALPSLAPALRLKAMPPESDEFRFAVAGLRRRMNEIAHQLREAKNLAEAFPASRA